MIKIMKLDGTSWDDLISFYCDRWLKKSSHNLLYYKFRSETSRFLTVTERCLYTRLLL